MAAGRHSVQSQAIPRDARRVGTISGTIGSGLESAFGSWSGGLIHDCTHGYNALIVFALVNVILGMLSFLVGPALRR